jgi:aldehyde dehydrogenase (NAD+)
MEAEQLQTEGKLNFETEWKYAPALESSEHVVVAAHYDLYINGAWAKPTKVAKGKNAYSPVINPANENFLSEVAIATEADVHRAVSAAQDGYRKYWSKMPARERGKYLFRIARMLQERAREFAVLESLNGGKPIRESRTVDVPLAAQHFFYYAGWADKLQYAFPGKVTRPLGVAAQVIPWNFPLLMAAWKIAPALACGNTVVLKPAETTPLTALKLAELFQEIDLPPGVVNILTGGPDVGRQLFAEKDINKIAFTGSTEVGKEILKRVAGTDLRYTLELGGKGAQIVFDDAPLDQAVEGIVKGIFFNQGHVCCAGSRLLVQESVYNEVMLRLKDRMQTLIVGDPLDKNTDIGAINSKSQCERIERYLALGKAEGVEVFQTSQALPEKGYWCNPTLLLNAGQACRVVQEEIFGPVLTVQTFRTPEEAIEKANNTPYGLSGGVWTDKGSKLFKVSSRIRAGVVWGNTFNKFDPAAPFGGVKESGVGREGGLHGLAGYLALS